MIDAFASFAEKLEVSRLHREIEVRENDLRNAENMRVVQLGEAAAANQGLTLPAVVAATWATVDRHREMMRRLGYGTLAPEYRPPGSRERRQFRIQAKIVPIAADMSIALAQQSVNTIEKGRFWDMFDDDGLEAALDAFASPSTTAIQVHDRKHPDGPVGITRLNPGGWQMPDADFREEWADHFSPFSHLDTFKAPGERSSGEAIDLTGRRLHPKELVVAAGLIAHFNEMLDEVEQNI